MEILERYFRPKSFESEGLYKALGVSLYNRYINPNSPTNRFTSLYREWRRPGGNFGGLPEAESMLDSVRSFEERSKRNELTHIACLAISGVIEITAQSLRAPAWVRVGNAAGAVGCNLYPILVQRYNRIRTTHVVEMLEAREAEQMRGYNLAEPSSFYETSDQT